jgi:hypothetical protein
MECNAASSDNAAIVRKVDRYLGARCAMLWVDCLEEAEVDEAMSWNEREGYYGSTPTMPEGCDGIMRSCDHGTMLGALTPGRLENGT